MTNAQKWVSVFLVLFVLLLALSKLTENEEQTSDSYYNEESVSVSSSEPKELNVDALLANNKCFVCHGRDLEGSGMGPALVNLSENWKAENLVSYLQNPKAFLNNPRMAILKDKYKSEMPAVKGLSAEELKALAEYLIAR
jgi:cytochrome c2